MLITIIAWKDQALGSDCEESDPEMLFKPDLERLKPEL